MGSKSRIVVAALACGFIGVVGLAVMTNYSTLHGFIVAFHGNNDGLPPEESARIEEELRRAGLPTSQEEAERWRIEGKSTNIGEDVNVQ